MAYPFLLSHENTPGAAAVCVRATKNPARSPARAAGVLSVNTFLEDSRYTSQEDFEGNFDVAEFLAFLTRDRAVCVESTGYARGRKSSLASLSSRPRRRAVQ